MEPITIKLSEPIEANGETINEITLTPPRARHFRSMPVKQTLDMGDLLDLASRLSGIPPSSIDQMSAADALKVVGEIANFLVDGPGGTLPS